MRFTSFMIAGALAVLASAQSSTSTSSAPTSTSSQDAAQASMIACIDACTAGDVDCTSKCIAVPNPNASQVNATNDCVAACPQGNGTAADTEKYATCVNDCIGQNYFTSTGTPQATGGSGSSASGSSASATATGSSASKSGSSASSTASGSSSSSSSSASASASGNAADSIRVATTGLGLFGMLAAFLAL